MRSIMMSDVAPWPPMQPPPPAAWPPSPAVASANKIVRFTADSSEKTGVSYHRVRAASSEDRAPQPPHPPQVIGHVVERRKPGIEDFARHEQMAQVRPARPRARVAGAFRVDRPGVHAVFRVGNDDLALRGEKLPVARVARRQRAVE